MTKHVLYRKSDLSQQNSMFMLEGIKGVANAGQTTNIDWQLPQERWVTGGQLILENHASGDSVSYYVVYKYQGGESVVGQFANNFYPVTDKQEQISIDVDYLSRLDAGLWIRIAYTSVGQTNVTVKLNLFSHIPKE